MSAFKSPRITTSDFSRSTDDILSCSEEIKVRKVRIWYSISAADECWLAFVSNQLNPWAFLTASINMLPQAKSQTFPHINSYTTISLFNASAILTKPHEFRKINFCVANIPIQPFYSYFNLISLSLRDEIHYYFYILSTHIIPKLYCTHIQIILLFVTRI